MSDTLTINYIESKDVVIVYGCRNGKCATPWIASINIEFAMNMLTELYPEYTEYAVKYFEMHNALKYKL